MESAPSQKNAAGELSQPATSFAESLARHELKCDVLGEVVDHQSLWTQFRQVFKQHMRIWQQFTPVTLSVAADGAVVGWLVESRKEKCGAPVLADAAVEERARSLKPIRRDLRLVGVRRVPLDPQRSLAVAAFAGPARTDACEVYVNHSTGEVIGYLPVVSGQVLPLPIKGPEAENALELAWQQVESDLKTRVGQDAATHAREVLKLVPQKASRDENQCSFWSFQLWRFFTTCDVEIDQTTKEIIGWYVEALQNDAPDRVISQAAAIQSARPELTATQGVSGPQVTFAKAGDAEQASVYWWHAEDGVNVEGDQTTVLLNATSGKPYSVSRKWRKIAPELLQQSTISLEQAIKAADRAISHNPKNPPGQGLGKAVIQIAADPESPSPVRDVLVWRVGYQENGGMGFTEVAVDCKTSEAVRITGW